MKLLDFFRTHNELVEILIEGTNPYATQRLSHADVDTLRAHLASDERIRSFAQGRCVGEGRTVWVVTSQALLVLHTGSAPVVRRIALADIEQVQLEKGRYGHGLRIAARGQRASIYGMARVGAVLTQRALAPATAAEHTLPADDVTQALHDLLDLQLRAQPLLVQAEAEARALLRQTAERARAEGLVLPAEAAV